jgi:formimidoylglutamase
MFNSTSGSFGTLRRPGKYNPPAYRDPSDVRLVRIIGQATRSVSNAVNILGVPFDGAVLGRKGAADGPAAIRGAMSGFSTYEIDLKMGLEKARVFDLGDLVVDQGDVTKTHRLIEQEVSGDLRSDSLLLLVGGDNSVSLPSLKAVSGRFGEIGLIVIDSHFDLRGKMGGKPTSGSSYGLAIEALPELGPNRVVEIGMHGFLNSRDYVRKAEKLGLTYHTASEVRSRGPAAIAREAYETAARGAEAVYLSVDLDALDLSHVSGVSAPSVGGLTPSELFEIVFGLARTPKVKCVDLVELAPSLDPTGKSQLVAATAVVYVIAGFHSRRRREEK